MVWKNGSTKLDSYAVLGATVLARKFTPGSITILGLVVIFGHLLTGLSIGSQAYSNASVGLATSNPSPAPGEAVEVFVSVRVVGDARASGALVLVPSQLQATSSGGCDYPCTTVYINDQGGVEMSVGRLLDGESATGSFSVLIPDHAVPGDSFHFSAYLLGGRATGSSAESSHLSITVRTPSAPVASELDDGMFWVESYPMAMMVRKGQMSSLFLQPVRAGISDDSDRIRLFLRIPSGIVVDQTSVQCGRGDSTMDYTDANCQNVEVRDRNNHQLIEVEPGFDVSTAANTVLVQFYVEDWDASGRLEISGTLSRLGQNVAAPNYGVQLISYEGTEFLDSEISAPTALIEHPANFSTTGDTCTIDTPYQIEVWSIGLESRVDSLIVESGILHQSTDGNGGQSCFATVSLDPQSGGIILTLTHGDSGGFLPCRACVMGSIPNDGQTISIFIADHP